MNSNGELRTEMNQPEQKRLLINGIRRKNVFLCVPCSRDGSCYRTQAGREVGSTKLERRVTY